MLTSNSPIVSQPSAVVSSLRKDVNAAPIVASAVPTAAEALFKSLSLRSTSITDNMARTKRQAWIRHIRLDNGNGNVLKAGNSTCWGVFPS